MKTIVLFLISIVLLACVQFTHQNERVYFVEVFGKKIYYQDKGEDNPTIVFLAGLGVSMEDFYKMQTELSKTSRVILYDRAGIGKSEAMGNDRNLKNISMELFDFLSKIGIEKPVILVGHSRGGLIARYFVSQFPEKALGLVLIDPAIPELAGRKRALRNESEQVQLDAIYKSFYTDTVEYSSTIRSEFKNFYTSDSSLLAGKSLPVSIPVTIIASNKSTSEKYGKEDVLIKEELLNSYLKAAPQTKLILTKKSGHFIYIEESELVIKEIKSMAAKFNGVED